MLQENTQTHMHTHTHTNTHAHKHTKGWDVSMHHEGGSSHQLNAERVIEYQLGCFFTFFKIY